LTLKEREAVMLRHLNDVIAMLGENIGIREMRKHLCWYTKGLPGGGEFRDKVNHLTRIEDVLRAIREYFTTLPHATITSPQPTPHHVRPPQDAG
jgi:tRNA-dihydrouridine synthase B